MQMIKWKYEALKPKYFFVICYKANWYFYPPTLLAGHAHKQEIVGR